MKIRKKLTATLIALVVNWLATWLASKGFDLTPDQQVTLVEAALISSAAIVSLFNVGQGIADKGKESRNDGA